MSNDTDTTDDLASEARDALYSKVTGAELALLEAACAYTRDKETT